MERTEKEEESRIGARKTFYSQLKPYVKGRKRRRFHVGRELMIPHLNCKYLQQPYLMERRTRPSISTTLNQRQGSTLTAIPEKDKQQPSESGPCSWHVAFVRHPDTSRLSSEHCRGLPSRYTSGLRPRKNSKNSIDFRGRLCFFSFR